MVTCHRTVVTPDPTLFLCSQSLVRHEFLVWRDRRAKKKRKGEKRWGWGLSLSQDPTKWPSSGTVD